MNKEEKKIIKRIEDTLYDLTTAGYVEKVEE